ncbi:hypothetical protein ACH46L_03300 [Streptomyces althioticus]|uniref:hypothetical protein n=1 Tax=Streptomyces althioticus TaxID=83380 RepID=UPI00379E7C16
MRLAPTSLTGTREPATLWLLRAAPDTETALAEWDGANAVAVLVAGRAWDAIRVPYGALGFDFDGLVRPEDLRGLLDRLGIAGPVFCDPYRAYMYFLVPPGTDREWPHGAMARAGIECFGGHSEYVHHVGVPRVDRTDRPGPHWLVTPDCTAREHVDPAVLLGALEKQSRRAARDGAR